MNSKKNSRCTPSVVGTGWLVSYKIIFHFEQVDPVTSAFNQADIF